MHFSLFNFSTFWDIFVYLSISHSFSFSYILYAYTQMVTTMGQEEKSQRQSKKTSSGGSCCRSSKKLKPKKVPQRGLGVAQLEKIRREEEEEEEQKDVAALQAASFFSTNASCFSAVQCTNFRPQLSHPFPCVVSPADHIPSSRSSFRISPPFTSADRPTNSVSISTPNSVGGCKLNPQGSAIHGNGKMPYGSNTPIRHLPCVLRRSEQCQQPCCSSSMVNVPSAVSSSSSSSVKNFQIEPPSNQSYCYTTPVWPDEDKMVGIETLYPVSIDNAPVPSFNSRFPPESDSFIPRTDERCNRAGTFNLKPTANPVLSYFPRQGSSSSNSTSEQRMRLVVEENEGFNADFLTLAPPKPKHTLQPVITNRQDFDSPPYQGTTVGIVKWRGPGLSVQRPFFSFLPSATQHDQSASTKSNCNGLVESVDLNLKL